MQSTTRPGFSNLLSAMFVNGRGKRRRLSSTARSSSIESLELRTLLTNVTADITTSQTWTAAGSPYILQNSVSIRNGATLTIGEGVQVRAASTSYVLNVGQAGETGVLNSIASTANGVTFSTNLSVSSSGTATIARNRFDSGRLVIQSGSNVTLTGNSFHSGKTESTTPIWIDPELVPILEGTPASPNIFAANTQVGILAGTIDSPGVVWKKLGLNEGYRLLYNDDVVVANGGSLTIDSSNTISREGDLSEIYVRNAGSFNAANVQLDSVIEFQANSTATLSNNSLTAGRFQIQSGSNVTLTGNSFHSGKTESTTPIWIDPELVPILEGTPASPNIFAANTQVGILAGTIDSPGVVWKKLGLNEGYRLLYNDDVVVANGGSLTIDSSNTISREGDLSEIYVRNAGSFNAANVQLDSVIEFQANSTATLSNNSLTAGRFQIQSGSNVTLTGNSFHSGKTESTTPIWIDPELVPILEGTPASPNIFAANTQVGILAGTIDSPGVVWKKLGLNEGYRLLYNDDVVVANGGSLTIDSSNTISREGDLSEIYVRNAGSFNAANVQLDSVIEFQANSTATLSNNSLTAGRFQIQSGSNVTLTGNSFHSGKTESTTPIWIDPELVPILEGTPASPNIFAANTQVGILAGTIDSPGVVWKKLGLNEGYRLLYNDDVVVANGGSLTIDSSNTISREGDLSEIYVRNAGSFNAANVQLDSVIEFQANSTATLSNNSLTAGRFQIQSGSNVTLTGNSFHSGKTESTTPIWIDPELVPILEGTPASPNIFAANTQVGILAGTIDSPGVVWKKLGLNEGYRLLYNDDVVVANGGSLTIDSSNTISREGDLSEIYVRNAGRFSSTGNTISVPVVFQSGSDGRLERNLFTGSIDLRFAGAIPESPVFIRRNDFRGSTRSSLTVPLRSRLI